MESDQGKLRGMIGRVFPTLASLPRALRGFCWYFSASDMATNAGSEEVLLSLYFLPLVHITCFLQQISSVENEVEKKEQASEASHVIHNRQELKLIFSTVSQEERSWKERESKDWYICL